MLPEQYPINGKEGYPRATPMRVIVCGFLRTGTYSMLDLSYLSSYLRAGVVPNMT